MIRIAIIASTQPYQEAAAWAASTYARIQGHSATVSVYIPIAEAPCETLTQLSQKFGFAVSEFPFTFIPNTKFTCQLKCQGFHFVIADLSDNDFALLVDADTFCLRPFKVSRFSKEIRMGKIGLVPDLLDHHFTDPENPWYLPAQHRLRYVNSGVILTSNRALDIFTMVLELSKHPSIDYGWFNDQKVLNFVLGKFFRERLFLLASHFNTIGPSYSDKSIIGHCAGGAGRITERGRKSFHEAVCREILEKNETLHGSPCL